MGTQFSLSIHLTLLLEELPSASYRHVTRETRGLESQPGAKEPAVQGLRTHTSETTEESHVCQTKSRITANTWVVLELSWIENIKKNRLLDVLLQLVF